MDYFDEEKYQSSDELIDENLKERMAVFFENFEDSFPVYKEGNIIEGEIIDITKNMIWLSLNNHFIGFIPSRELSDEEILVSDLQIGDKINCFVVEPENEGGYVICSLRKAGREQAWKDLQEKFNKKTILEVKPVGANKGGLMVEIRGIRGFLPVSQLAPEHYPRVKDGNEQEILSRLLKLVGQPLKIRVISVAPEENKLIVSEKEAKLEEREEKVSKYKEGQLIKGKVIGLADFGAFVDLGEVEGLIHISEISWERVDKVNNYIKEGEEVEVMVIGTEYGKVSLSLKRLKPDPWSTATKNLKLGKKVKAQVTRITPFGAFVQLENGLEGLVHISELSFKHVSNPADLLSVGDEVDLKIINVDSKNHKIELSLKQLQDKPKELKEDKLLLNKFNNKDNIDKLREVLSKSCVDNLKKAGYKTIASILKLSVDDLSKVPGIGSKTAEKIFKVLR